MKEHCSRHQDQFLVGLIFKFVQPEKYVNQNLPFFFFLIFLFLRF